MAATHVFVESFDYSTAQDGVVVVSPSPGSKLVITGIRLVVAGGAGPAMLYCADTKMVIAGLSGDGDLPLPELMFVGLVDEDLLLMCGAGDCHGYIAYGDS